MVSHTRIFAALVALAAAALPVRTVAQTTPVAAPPPAAPPSYARTDETIHGTVTSYDGSSSLQIHDDRGYIDNVQLHLGTVINPTGIRLTPGMDVTIHGVNAGPTFAASEIDTPYSPYGPIPIYPDGPYAYPYPVYAYPYPVYAYPYGPAFSLGIHFGPSFHHR